MTYGINVEMHVLLHLTRYNLEPAYRISYVGPQTFSGFSVGFYVHK